MKIKRSKLSGIAVIAGWLMAFVCGISNLQSQTKNNADAQYWVDSVYNNLTQEQRIAQLVWPMVEQLNDSARVKSLLNMVKTFQPGGILVMKNKANDIASFINKSQAISKVPLFTAIDAEWGLAMRVDGVTPYPRAMTLGAISNDTLIYLLGLDMANQLKLLGFSVGFGPVADVNSNPLNPVIGTRSFGENALRVSKNSVALMLGLQDGGIMAVAKHFPGHGDTQTDSHHVLPFLNHNRQRFDSLELVPFAALIKNGIYGVMTAHLEVPGLESKKGLPSSLSRKVVNDLLKIQMGFQGLIITDAMNMKGVKMAGQPGRVDAMALMAGNDVVESSENIALTIEEVKKAINSNELTWFDIETKCKKVLMYKYLLGVNDFNPVDVENILAKINSGVDYQLMQQLVNESLTVVKKDSLVLDFSHTDSIAIFLMPHQRVWRDSLLNLPNSKIIELSGALTTVQLNKLKVESEKFHQCVWIMDGAANSKTFWSNAQLTDLRNHQSARFSSVLVYTASPYQLAKLIGARKMNSVFITYEDSPFVKNGVKQLLTGKLKAKGSLPVNVELN